MQRLGLAAMALVTIAGVAWAAPASRPPVSRAVYNRPSGLFPAGDVARGRVLAETCLACHAEAAPMVGDPEYHAPKLRYQRLTSIFYALQDYRAGRRKNELMTAAAAALSDQDMRDVSAALSARSAGSRLTGAALAGKAPPGAGTWAYQHNEEVCGMCHGETGLGEMDGYPVLGGQHRDYLEHALADYRSGVRSNSVMQQFARSLKPGEAAKMAEYFAAQTALESAQ